MKLYFVRHGQPDYQSPTGKRDGSWDPDLAPLTPIGRLQIDTIARDYRLQEAEAVLSSSYSRALESAALLAGALDKPFFVEYDLHEWRPHDGAHGPADPDLLRRAAHALRFGEDPGQGPWETLDEVRRRVLSVLQRYRSFDRLVVVSHAVVIASVVGVLRPVEHAEIVPFDLDPDHPPAVPRSEARRPEG